jgi:ABC-type sugar transport system permease subunit
MSRRATAEPYAYVFPLLALEALFVAVPLGIGFYYSLHQADYFQLKGFRGLDNYLAVLQSPLVQESLIATAIFALGSLIFTFALGFSLALYLERDTRLNAFVRAVVPFRTSSRCGRPLLLSGFFSV